MPATVAPNLGLYLDRPPLAIPKGGLQDGFNFRIKDHTIQTHSMGWVKFSDAWVLDGPVRLIDNFFPREGVERLIFATDTSIYNYDPDDDIVEFLNPIYAAGTVSATTTAVTGSGTTWSTNVKAGDFISFGSATENDPEATWYEIALVGGNTSITLVSPGVGSPVAGGTAYTIRQTLTAGAFDTWDTDAYVSPTPSGTDYWIATNGADPVISWDGEAATVTLHPEMNFTCRAIAVSWNMVIYGGLVVDNEAFPASIINSNVGSPFAAGDTGTGVSEQFQVHGGSDEILNIVPLGDNIVMYSNRHVVTAQFVGDPYVFVFRQATTSIGPIAAGAIADFGDYHEFIATDSQYTFDGVTIEEINQHVMRGVLKSADPLRRFRVYSHFDEEQGDLIWSVPLNTDDGVGESEAAPEQAYTEHYLEDVGPNRPTAWSRRALPFTSMGFYQQTDALTWADLAVTWESLGYAWDDQFLQAAFPINLGGGANGQVYIANNGSTGDGVALPNWVKFGRMALGSGRERSLLTRIYPFTEESPDPLTVRAYMLNYASRQALPTEDMTFEQTGAEVDHFVSVFRRGRFFDAFFGSETGKGWTMDGWDYDFVEGGLR